MYNKSSNSDFKICLDLKAQSGDWEGSSHIINEKEGGNKNTKGRVTAKLRVTYGIEPGK